MQNEYYLEGFKPAREMREDWRDTCQCCGKKGAKWAVHGFMSEIGKKLIVETLQYWGKLLPFDITIEGLTGKTELREVEALVNKDSLSFRAYDNNHAECLNKALKAEPKFMQFVDIFYTVGWRE